MPGSYRPKQIFIYILYNNLFILHLRIKHNKIKYQILNGQNNKQNDKYIYRTLHYQSTRGQTYYRKIQSARNLFLFIKLTTDPGFEEKGAEQDVVTQSSCLILGSSLSIF